MTACMHLACSGGAALMGRDGSQVATAASGDCPVLLCVVAQGGWAVLWHRAIMHWSISG